jgi:DNA-binding transcriptional LysR family regulator
LNGFPVYRQGMLIALPASHPLTKTRGAIAPSALAQETFVSTTIGYDFVFDRHVEILARLGGFTPRIIKRAQDLVTVLTYVAAGFGIAGVSREMTRCGVPNVVFKDIASQDAPDLVFDCIYRASETAPACRLFIDAMRSHALKAGAGRQQN